MANSKKDFGHACGNCSKGTLADQCPIFSMLRKLDPNVLEAAEQRKQAAEHQRRLASQGLIPTKK